MRLLVLIAIVCAVSTSAVYGQNTPRIGVFADPEGTDMQIRPPGDGGYIFPIYVVVFDAPWFSAIEFSAPLPPCFSNASFVVDLVHTPSGLYIGNSQTGLAIAFGTCIPSPALVATIYLHATEPLYGCCEYPVLPSPSAASGEIQLVDCGGNLVNMEGMTSIVGEFCPPTIGDPTPPDGAVGQPMNTQLSWEFESHSYSTCATTHSVYFGTTPNPPRVAIMLGYSCYDPGLLLPATTYYWKVIVSDCGAGAATSPVWRFTTAGGVPAYRTTWGRVKKLYSN